MFRRYAHVITAISFLAAGGIARADKIDPNNPPQGRFADDWAEVYMGDAKIGYYHSTMTRREDLIDTAIKFYMRMGRVDQPVTISMEQNATEKVDGTPISFAISAASAAASSCPLRP